MPNIHPDDQRWLELARRLYLADEEGLHTSIAEVQEAAYRLGIERAESAGRDVRRLLDQISQAHGSGLSRATHTRIAQVLA